MVRFFKCLVSSKPKLPNHPISSVCSQFYMSSFFCSRSSLIIIMRALYAYNLVWTSSIFCQSQKCGLRTPWLWIPLSRQGWKLSDILFMKPPRTILPQLGGVEAFQPYEGKKYATRIKSIFIQSAAVCNSSSRSLFIYTSGTCFWALRSAFSCRNSATREILHA